jgi:hypothetical protein
MKWLALITFLFSAQLSSATTKNQAPSVGDLMISCSQNFKDRTDFDAPFYTATVFASKNGQGTLILTDQGVVVAKLAVKTGGNGDTFATASGADGLLFFVDAEDMSSGKLEIKLKGKLTTIEFTTEDANSPACSETPRDWHWGSDQ